MARRPYPRSTGEFQSWFATDADCLDYLEWLRWPDGFVCPGCAHVGGWALGDGRFKCAGCGARTAVTAGTLFDRRRTPLTVWFTACWMFAAQKDGVSALSLQRALEIGSYPTAWAMLHRLRSVLVRPGRDLLSGIVEVDETYIGGEEPGLRGGRAKGKKSLVAVAVEVRQPRGYGRCRMAILDDASATSLHRFVSENVEPGSTVITDAWQGYRRIDTLGHTHERRSQRGPCPRRGPRPTAARGSSHRVAGKAVAARHPPGLGGRGAPAELPERIRLPLQPAPLQEPRHALLPPPRTRGRTPSGALPRPGCRPTTQGHPARCPERRRPPTEPGPPPCSPSLARNRSKRSGQLNTPDGTYATLWRLTCSRKRAGRFPRRCDRPASSRHSQAGTWQANATTLDAPEI